MTKRAIELQFHWIFILIAGGIILAFFFSVVQKQRALSEEKLSIMLAAQMDAIYTGAIESKGTTQALATPKSGIAFACTKTCECNYIIGDKATEFRDKLIFAPAFVSDLDVIAWAAEWKLPFRIANFLILTNPEIKYYMVYDAGDLQSAQLYARISKELPKELNLETISSGDVGQLTPQGYVHTRFIFFGVQPRGDSLGLSQAFEEEEVSAIVLDPDLQTLVFYEKSDPEALAFDSYQSLLAGEASAFAAVAVADHQMYNCVTKHAFEKFSMVAGVNARRARMLHDAMGMVNPACAYAWQSIDDVAQAAQQLSTSFPDEEILSRIRGVQAELQRVNNNLILQSCPELY